MLAYTWKTPTGKQIPGRPAAGLSRSASMYGGVYGNSGAVIWHSGFVRVLSSASRDNLDTFVGASPRRGTAVWRDIRYVAGEERVPLRAEHFCRGDECNVMARASNTTSVTDSEAGWRATIRPAL